MQRSRHRTLFAVFSLMLSTILLAALVVGRPAAAQSSMLELAFRVATDINDAGQVVGGGLWQDGVLIPLNQLPGGDSSSARSINNRGQIAGQSNLETGDYHAIFWENSTSIPIDLGVLSGGLDSRAFGINNNGQVVGQSQSATGDWHAFLWDQASGMIDLGALPGGSGFESRAYAINDNGQVVGWSDSPSGTRHAFLWEQSTGMIDLGPRGETSSEARSINNSGQIVGYIDPTEGEGHAVLWQNGTMTDLGALDGRFSGALDINDLGQIVGVSRTPSGAFHAFFWDNGTMSDLGTLGGAFSEAWAINNNGQIVGESDTSAGLRHGFLTTAPSSGGSISGQVTDSSSNPLPGAPVQACLNSGACAVTTTDSLGNYMVAGLPPGQYFVKAFPPAASNFLSSEIGPLDLADGATVAGQNIELAAMQPPPPGTSISPSSPGNGGIPMVSPWSSQQLTTLGCVDGAASYQVIQNDMVVRSDVMAEGPAGTYSASILAFAIPRGYATVSISITCPDASTEARSFTVLYIDPSGTVRTLGGAPIQGAIVTLLRADTAAGPFTPVPNGDAIMSPANRANPDTSDVEGHFGWDVVAGFYKVRAEKAGCDAPVESDVRQIPPPVTDLDLRLNCETDPPTITINTPADGASYMLHQAVAASYSCTDDGSGVASCDGTVANGAAIDTGTVGTYTFAVNATDQAGNPSSASASYSVVYDFSGFFAPIATARALNVMQAGRAIPLQFSLHGDQGLDIFAAGYPTSQLIACDTTAPIGSAEPIATAGPNSLSYDAGADQYSYNWKTDKRWAGSCRQLVVLLADGTEHRANFTFK